MDIKRHRKQVKDTKPEFNLVPFIDILFTLLIFVVVTSSFNTAGTDAVSEGGTGKPDIIDISGDYGYYLLPVAGLEKVIVNGHDMSSFIRNNAIAIQVNVIDKGEINIKPKYKSVIITTPPGMNPEQAVCSPQ